MIWSAWADALGFISELTSPENLRRRTKGRPLAEPMPWARVVGGRTGVRAELPEGCYSDDTQLRLATSRCITPFGFDVEAFARVELTVWPSYALGGGRATKAAALGMSRQQANWINNFYDGWNNAGGNGAAMRIQPHVYAAADLGKYDHLADVVRNSIVTHGHPRGIAGAVFHAVCLTIALNTGHVPAFENYGAILDATRNAASVFSADSELAAYWVPQWERKSGGPFFQAWDKAVDEIANLLRISEQALLEMASSNGDRIRAASGYEKLVSVLSLGDPQSRGSGTKTTVAALLLSTAFPEHPAQAAQVAAGVLNTDTDTIATMAAAIVAAASPRAVMSPVMDAEYVRAEATRLVETANGVRPPGFAYPDLLTWQPPRSALEGTGDRDGQLVLAGISQLEVIGKPISNRDAVWSWGLTDFGQSVLVKRRHDLRQLAEVNWPVRPRTPKPTSEADVRATLGKAGGPQGTPQPEEIQPTLYSDEAVGNANYNDVDSLMAWLEENQFRNADIGRAIRILASFGRSQDVVDLAERVARHLFHRQ